MLIELTLFCALLQQPRQATTITLPPDHRVAVILDNGQTQFTLTLKHARELYDMLERKKTRSEDEERWHAALTMALGTLPRMQAVAAPRNSIERSRREQLRWQRRALQRKENHGRQ